MKVIVDEMPKTPYECLFKRYECGYAFCTLKNDDVCDIERNEKCKMLLKAGGTNGNSTTDN